MYIEEMFFNEKRYVISVVLIGIVCYEIVEKSIENVLIEYF